MGLLFLLAHEFVDNGRFYTNLKLGLGKNLPKYGTGDAGTYWEIKTFGKPINLENSYEMSKKFNWRTNK